MSQPIVLYSHASGPNPWKVAMLLEELGVNYENVFFPIAELHTPVYEKINPNGRVPAIEDPNTGITLWESGAIIEYLIDQYDQTHKLSFDSFPEKYLAKQFLFLQVSGQGPYFGQGTWFKFLHHEKLPSAIERYEKEIVRFTKVLDTVLEGKEYLVGGKCSYADLSFVMWYQVAPVVLGEGTDLAKEYPNFGAWMERLLSRPAVKKVLEQKAAVKH